MVFFILEKIFLCTIVERQQVRLPCTHRKIVGLISLPVFTGVVTARENGL
jgi:hypothetical protein